jgi:hypothetical protein
MRNERDILGTMLKEEAVAQFKCVVCTEYRLSSTYIFKKYLKICRIVIKIKLK